MKSQNTSLKYGIFTAVVLIVYFLFLGAIGLNANPAYSFVNAVISAVGISISLKSLHQKEKDGLDYYTGFKTGLMTGVYATIIFTIFFITYYSYDKSFAAKLLDNIKLDIDTGLLFLSVAVMGLASSLVITLALMQLHKKKQHI